MSRQKDSEKGTGMVFGSVGNKVADWYGQNRYVTVGIGLVGIVVLAVVVPVAIYHSIAASGAVSFEAENGSVSSQASTFTDANASNGQFVQFGNGSSGGNVAGMDTSCVFASAPAGTTRAFCDGFNSPTTNPAGSRSGEMNGLIWGVSRMDGDPTRWPIFDTNSHTIFDENLNKNVISNAGPLCGQTGSFPPPTDIKVCNGSMQTGLTSGNGVVAITMYPKQPFDFAGRTGTVVFDVSADSGGDHDIWPEFWLTDKPVPNPHIHATSWAALPKDGFGLVFAANCKGGGCAPGCQSGSPGDVYLNLSESSVIRNYVKQIWTWDSNAGGTSQVFDYGTCIKEPVTGDGKLNHIELRVSQNKIDVYGTDAATPSTMTPGWIASHLVRMATLNNVNLSLTKGLIWINDAQYNPEKGDGTHFYHRSLWDNVGFDGPKTYRDLAYDAPDNTPATAPAYVVGPSSSKTVTVKGVSKGTADKGASACAATPCALLTFNFTPFDGGGTSLNHSYKINGNSAHAIPWPFSTPDKSGLDAMFDVNSPRTIGIPIDINEVINGDNTVTFTNNSNNSISYNNIDLIMVNAAPVP